MYQIASSSTIVSKTYSLPLKFLNSEHRDAINQRIRELEEDQLQLLDKRTVETALDICRENPHDLYPRSKLSKTIGKSPNIAESAFHWLFVSLKNRLNQESKINQLFIYWMKNPQQAIEWIVFGRSPYTESKFSDKWKSKYIWVLNLLTSTRRQVDSYWRKKSPNIYRKHQLKFNSFLPLVTHYEVEQAISDAYENKLDEFAKLSTLTDKQNAFLRKLHLILSNKSLVAPYLTSWINTQQTSRWKSLKLLSSELAIVLGNKSRKLFSTLRLIIIFALFPHLWTTVLKMLKASNPEEFISMPFKKKRGKLPIKLMMNKKYVITRPGNAEIMTNLAINNGEFELGFPSKNRSKLTASLLFPKKVRNFLKNGAQIKVLQIESGIPPSNKPNVKVVLEGNSECFISTKLTVQYMRNIPLNNSTIMGVDINRLSEHMVAFNYPVKIPRDLIKLSKKYHSLTKNQIRSLHISLAIKGKQKDTYGYCKIRGELKRVYARRARLLKEIKNKLPHFLAAVIIQNKSQYLCIENLQISARGKKGALAKAIYNMPDDLEIFKKAVLIASMLSTRIVRLVLVNPQNTSRLHNKCGGTLDRGFTSYDYAPCKKCNKRVNTHINAAKNIAQKGAKVIHNNSPSTHVRGLGVIPSSGV